MSLRYPVCKEVDVYWYRGDTRGLPVRLWSEDNREARDIVGDTIELVIDENENPVDTMTQVAFITATKLAPSTDGKMVFYPSASDVNYADVTYWYTITVIDSGDKRWTVQKGKWIFLQQLDKADISS